MSASAKTSVMNQCLIRVSALPLERYCLLADGRKWQSRARSRQSVLNFIARFANTDGTFTRNGINYSPSEARLMKHFGFSDTWIELLLDDLHQLGFLNWTRANRQGHREYTIIVSDSDDKDSSKSDANYSNPDAKDSPNPDANYSTSDANYSSLKPVLTPSIRSLTPTIGGSDANSRVGISVLSAKEPREREPSSGQNLSHSPSAVLDKANAPQVREVAEQDIEAVQDLCLRLTGQTDDPSLIRKLLENFSVDHVLGGFENFYGGLSKEQQGTAKLLFFVKGGGASAIRRYRAERWKTALQHTAETASTPTAVDEWVRSNPAPTECVANIDKLVAAAKRTQKRTLEAAAAREKEIAANGGTDFAQDAKDLVGHVQDILKHAGYPEHEAAGLLSGNVGISFNVTWVEREMRAAAAKLGHPLDENAVFDAAQRLLSPIIAENPKAGFSTASTSVFGMTLFEQLVNDSLAATTAAKKFTGAEK
jgi:hypothetical protein